MDYLVTDAELTSIANAIRTKTGSSLQIAFPSEFASEISALPVLDTSDATATAADIKSGKTAYVNGAKITGSYSPGTWTSTTRYFPVSDVSVPAGGFLTIGTLRQDHTNNGIKQLSISKDSSVNANISIYEATYLNEIGIIAYNSGTSNVTLKADKITAQYSYYTA